MHVLKTSEGGDFAARQVTKLIRAGIHVHVVLPSPVGAALPLWKASGAVLHFADLDFPVRKPWDLYRRLLSAKKIVREIQPDLIHSHFFGPTLILRYALGKKHATPRIFQVPGPLHLENRFFKFWELSAAGPKDYWIASSHFIERIYLEKINREKVFVSYYGFDTTRPLIERSFKLHDRLDISRSNYIVGNVSYMYPPKFYLGQRVGLKCHEDLIDALAGVIQKRNDVVGVLVGGAWGQAKKYEERLRARAFEKGGGRIKLTGFLPPPEVAGVWADMDIAIHVPLSENCGGVAEPLLMGVPVIASNVGGLPEVVEDGVTGNLVPVREPKVLEEKILTVLNDLPAARLRSQKGRLRVQNIFDIERTTSEIISIYKRILYGCS